MEHFKNLKNRLTGIDSKILEEFDQYLTHRLTELNPIIKFNLHTILTENGVDRPFSIGFKYKKLRSLSPDGMNKLKVMFQEFIYKYNQNLGHGKDEIDSELRSYIDPDSDYNIIDHELSHLLGFEKTGVVLPESTSIMIYLARSDNEHHISAITGIAFVQQYTLNNLTTIQSLVSLLAPKTLGPLDVEESISLIKKLREVGDNKNADKFERILASKPRHAVDIGH